MCGKSSTELLEYLLLLAREVFLFGQHVLQLGVVGLVVAGQLRLERSGLALPEVDRLRETVIVEEIKGYWDVMPMVNAVCEG